MSNCMRLTKVKKTFCLVLVLALTSLACAAEDRAIETEVDAFMVDLMKRLDVVPGYSIAVVTPDSTILAKGYGVTAVSGGVPMSADTQVYIASSTKSLTALAVASLDNKGLIDLDVPISEYVPALSESAAGHVTLRQLLSHSHGLKEDALTWRTAYSGQYTDEGLLALVEGFALAANAGEFEYSNTGYVVASLVLQQRFNKSWKEIVADEVLTPVGMKSTTAYVSALDKNYAHPHSWFGVKNQFPLAKQDNTMHAAGGHFSTAQDMALWLQAQLSDGQVNGRQVFAPGVIRGTQAPNVSLDADFYSYQRHHYGLGWYLADYRGQLMLHQFGSFAGYRSHVSFIPELGIGVAVLANDASRPGFNLPDMIANYIYDLAAGRSEAEGTSKQEIAGIASMIEPMSGRTPPERPRNAPADEARFAGKYTNQEFGTIEFSMTDNGLAAKFGNLSSATTYKEDGSIRMELVPFHGTLGRFIDNEREEVVGFEYRDTNYQRVKSVPEF